MNIRKSRFKNRSRVNCHGRGGPWLVSGLTASYPKSVRAFTDRHPWLRGPVDCGPWPATTVGRRLLPEWWDATH